MYWWSNTAVPEKEGARVAVPASDAYIVESGVIIREPFPFPGGVDVSYPMNTKSQKDYFYYLPDDARKYEGYIFTDGTGLIQASTSRLKGRKLFVWGQQPGGETWQRFLNEDAGSYVEIQAGLGRTQYGCEPMQPFGTWEFAEVYGPIAIDPDVQKADYPVFRSAVETSLEKAIPTQFLEDWLVSTAGSMGHSHAKALSYGGGEAALENRLRVSAGLPVLNAGLDFGETGLAQCDFEHLLTYGYMPRRGGDHIPETFVSGRHWCELLETAATGPDRDNWLTWYHLGLVLMDEDNHNRQRDRIDSDLSAVSALRRAADIEANGSVLYALSEEYIRLGRFEEAAACAIKSCRLFGGDLSVAKDAMRILVSTRAYNLALALYDSLPENVRADGRIKFWYASALVYTDRCEEALSILSRPGYAPADFRESEQSVNLLCEEIRHRTGDANITLPPQLNFNAH